MLNPRNDKDEELRNEKSGKKREESGERGKGQQT
jgi:hypothetical protein